APDGFVVTWVEPLADALACLATEPFDVMLCDLSLPDSSGMAGPRSIVERFPALPMVVLTGSHVLSMGRDAIHLGLQDYLVKGKSDPEMVVRTLRYAMERKGLENALIAANSALEQRVAERSAELEMSNRVLRNSLERNQAFLRNASDGVYILDAEGKVLELSDSLCTMLGYTRAELVGAHVSLWNAQWNPLELQSVLGKLAAKADRSEFETRHRRKDGTILDVEVSGQRLELSGETLLYLSARDVTEKRRADRQILDQIEQLKSSVMSTVEVATVLNEMRDPYTAGHERRVAAIAAAIGAHLGFDENRQEGLRVAGHLHDVGKVIVPSEILSKPGKLGALEYQMIQGHAQAGFDVLKNVKFPWPVAEVALQHHERMDGGGYPQGLKGEAILLEARIMAVADVVEAMSSHRPYRSGLGIEEALAEVEGGGGTKYDRTVVEACLTLFREKGYSIPA
ncbi:MAG: HD domain-containing protein, partial [Burkholderiales bacterium]|nr:HD domain-containing protein [Burkholderiales bacterium]